MEQITLEGDRASIRVVHMEPASPAVNMPTHCKLGKMSRLNHSIISIYKNKFLFRFENMLSIVIVTGLFYCCLFSGNVSSINGQLK